MAELALPGNPPAEVGMIPEDCVTASSRRVERVGRSHDAASEEMLPDVVDRGARELHIAGDVAGERRAIVSARRGRVVAEDVLRSHEAARFAIAVAKRLARGPVAGG